MLRIAAGSTDTSTTSRCSRATWSARSPLAKIAVSCSRARRFQRASAGSSRSVVATTASRPLGSGRITDRSDGGGVEVGQIARGDDDVAIDVEQRRDHTAQRAFTGPPVVHARVPDVGRQRAWRRSAGRECIRRRRNASATLTTIGEPSTSISAFGRPIRRLAPPTRTAPATRLSLDGHAATGRAGRGTSRNARPRRSRR